jgi:ElaB/YqjD/DUF883 family membrane-anchored ribosome-binding protein
MSQGTESAGESRSALEQAAGTAREKTGELSQQVSSRFRDEVNQRSTQAGEQVRSVAEVVRRTGEQLRQDAKEREANVADQAEQRVNRLADYLVEADADRIVSDIEDFARRRPWAAVVAGAALGFAASRFLKASSGRRFEEQRLMTQRQGHAELSAAGSDGREEPVAPEPAGRTT